MVVLFGFLFGCFACFCVLVGCFVLELALLRSDLCSTFEPPKRDIVNAFANSFNQHNKVRRPGKSHRGAGRKKRAILNFKATVEIPMLGTMIENYGDFFFRPAPLWLSPGRRTLSC